MERGGWSCIGEGRGFNVEGKKGKVGKRVMRLSGNWRQGLGG